MGIIKRIGNSILFCVSYYLFCFGLLSFDMYHINSDPIKFPNTHIIIEVCHVFATPMVIMFAIQCWKPQKMNKGIPNIIPSGVPFLYIYTAIYIITPHKNDFMRNAIDRSQVDTFFIAASIILVSAILKSSPNR